MSLFAPVKQFWRRFRLKREPFVCVDLSVSHVKLLRLESRAGRFVVCFYASADLPKGCFEGGEIRDIDAIGRVIYSLVAAHNLKGARAIIALPRACVLEREVFMDDVATDYEMECEIAVNLPEYFPVTDEDLTFDFFSREKVMEDGVLRQPVYIVATKRGHVSSRENLLRKGGLEPVVVDVDCLAYERNYSQLCVQLGQSGEHQPVIAVFDVGNTALNLVVLKDSRHVYIRSHDFGSGELDRSAEQFLGHSYAQARESGESLCDVENAFKENLIHQFEHCLQLFYNNSAYHHVDYVVLAGGVVNMSGLADMCEQRLRLPCVIANPLVDVDVSPDVDGAALFDEAPRLFLLSGLARREYLMKEAGFV